MVCENQNGIQKPEIYPKIIIHEELKKYSEEARKLSGFQGTTKIPIFFPRKYENEK